MPNPTNEENWAARERLRRVEFLLWWRGWVGRNDLVDVFGISPAQASGDLQRYAAINPGAMIYQTSRKRYESIDAMKCVIHEPSFEEAVRVFLGRGSSCGGLSGLQTADSRLSVVSLPSRHLDVGIARRVLMALLERRRLRVRYLSVKSGKNDWRELVPAGLAWDGQRWHTRAWCGSRLEWRDFVVGRMVAAEWPGEVAGDLPEDKDWETFETVKVQLNPELSPDRRAGLRLDYGLSGETLELRVRSAMKPYLLAELFIDNESHLALPRHFVLSE